MDTMESTQNTKEQEIPGAPPYRLRDREQLRKRKLEAQEQKSSQEKSKSKRGRKGKASGISIKLTKKPEPELVSHPEPEPELVSLPEPELVFHSAPEPAPLQEPQPLQDQKEEVRYKVEQSSPQWERPTSLQQSATLSIIGYPASTSTDELGGIQPACMKISESLPLQAEDVPGENAPSEEQIVLSI
ncbi:procyclic form-specific polypeptide B1-alpha-like isoform X2 [Mobula hypostoma]|uniref:procyclic form-specific polypeptide B1-alpha-like isoform X2 n=1 Tax=Mobula hypostoma TaxID=723540 RepID=UPI002FC278A5